MVGTKTEYQICLFKPFMEMPFFFFYLCVSVHVFLGDDLQQRLCRNRHGHT